jgi:hypothetical protein
MLLLAGCATPLHVTSTTTSTTSGDGLFGEIYRLCPTNRINGPLDAAYESFTLPEWDKWLPVSKMIPRKNAWDCDDYALEMMLESRRLYRSLGTMESTPAIGIAVGRMDNTGFLGMKSAGLHALNIIHVKDHGWMFYEPQARRTTLVRDALRDKLFTIHWIVF